MGNIRKLQKPEIYSVPFNEVARRFIYGGLLKDDFADAHIREEYLRSTITIPIPFLNGPDFDKGPLGRVATVQLDIYPVFGSGTIDHLLKYFIGNAPHEFLLRFASVRSCSMIQKIYAIERGGVGKEIIEDQLDYVKQMGIDLILIDTVTEPARKLVSMAGFSNFHKIFHSEGVQMEWALLLANNVLIREVSYTKKDAGILGRLLTAAIHVSDDLETVRRLTSLLSDKSQIILDVHTPYLAALGSSIPREIDGKKVSAFVTYADPIKLRTCNPNLGWTYLNIPNYAVNHICFFD